MHERHLGQGDSLLHTGRGSTRIGDKVVSKIAGATAGEVEGVLMGGNAAQTAGGLFESVTGSQGRMRGASARVGKEETAIDLTVRIEYGSNIPRTLERVRDEVTGRVEGLTGLRITELNFTVSDVVSATDGKGKSRGEESSGSQASTPKDEARPRVRHASELRIASEAKGETIPTYRGATEMSDRYSREDEARRLSARRLSEERTGGEKPRVRRSYQSGGQSEDSGQDQQNDEGGNQPSGTYGSSVDSSNVVGAAIAELIGTFILIFTGCAVAVAAILQRPTAGPGIYDSLAVALAFGLALVAIVAAIGHVSGAHVNPAVTLALAATKKFSWQFVPIYVGAQLVGALLGAVAVWVIYGDASRELANVAATFPAEGVGDLRALIAEILVTFILVFVIISVATDDRAPAGVAPLAVGFALACGVFIAGPVTGGSLNPARTLGPMIVAFDFTAVWVYIVGPVIGAVLAALAYDRFASQSDASG